MYLLFNANTDKAKVTIPEGKWKVLIGLILKIPEIRLPADSGIL